MTQEQLAEQMNVSTQTISYTEQGSKSLRPENLVRLCKILGVSTDYILTGEAPVSSASEIAKKLSHLTKEETELIKTIIDSCIRLCEEKIR